MLNIVVYWWGEKYPPFYLERLKAGIQRNLDQPYRFVLISDQKRPGAIVIPEQDRYLLRMKGCFARLRLFDPRFQKDHELRGRIVSIDLDMIVVGKLDPLFDREDEFSSPCTEVSILTNPHVPYGGLSTMDVKRELLGQMYTCRIYSDCVITTSHQFYSFLLLTGDGIRHRR